MRALKPAHVFSGFALASLLAALVFASLAQNLLWPSHGLIDVKGYAVGRDFVNVWNGPRLALAGGAATLFDVEAYHASLRDVFGPGFPFHNWSYPPHALVLFSPFGALPYLPALVLWTSATMAGFLAAVRGLLPEGRRTIGLALAALSPASLINVGFGQNGHLTAALMLGGIGCLERRPRLAGVLFGVLTIKPHLGLLVPFALVAIGAWRTIGWAASTTAVLVALSVALFGIDPWRLYAGVTVGVQGDILVNGQGGVFVAMMPTVFQAAKQIVGAGLAAPLQAAVTLVAAALTLAAFRRAPDAATRALALTSGTLLALPYAFNYDMMMLAGATIAVLATRRPGELGPALWLAPAWVAPVLIVPLGLWGYPLGPLALIAAFAAAMLSVWRPASVVGRGGAASSQAF